MKYFTGITVLLVLLILISGCQTRERIVFQRVEIPVTEDCPVHDELSFPIFPVDLLHTRSSDRETAEAFANSIDMCKTEIKIRDALLDGYRKPRESSK